MDRQETFKWTVLYHIDSIAIFLRIKSVQREVCLVCFFDNGDIHDVSSFPFSLELRYRIPRIFRMTGAGENSFLEKVRPVGSVSRPKSRGRRPGTFMLPV